MQTYGSYAPPTDPERQVTKINFFGNSVRIRESDRSACDGKGARSAPCGSRHHPGANGGGDRRFTTNFRDAGSVRPGKPG